MQRKSGPQKTFSTQSPTGTSGFRSTPSRSGSQRTTLLERGLPLPGYKVTPVLIGTQSFKRTPPLRSGFPGPQRTPQARGGLQGSQRISPVGSSFKTGQITPPSASGLSRGRGSGIGTPSILSQDSRRGGQMLRGGQVLREFPQHTRAFSHQISPLKRERLGHKTFPFQRGGQFRSGGLVRGSKRGIGSWLQRGRGLIQKGRGLAQAGGRRGLFEAQNAYRRVPKILFEWAFLMIRFLFWWGMQTDPFWIFGAGGLIFGFVYMCILFWIFYLTILYGVPICTDYFIRSIFSILHLLGHR